MASNFHLKKFLLNSEYTLFAISSFLAAVAIIAVLSYTKRSKAGGAIPLYAPEKSERGDYKRRWQFDSANLLKEAYEKVLDRSLHS